jgi:hypothetical protein
MNIQQATDKRKHVAACSSSGQPEIFGKTVLIKLRSTLALTGT